ncbi:hypothetical protein SZ64_04560 [Erythrobacter sp. SG61-1L]|nr:hypothetical protein SZ64_04560 [Erythrobacter sp. SG61-1L]
MVSRIIVAATSLLMVSACSSAAERAERRFEIAEKNGIDPRDACRAAGEAKQEWLNQGNEREYQRWMIVEYNACSKLR